jgi:hypothetical protein
MTDLYLKKIWQLDKDGLGFEIKLFDMDIGVILYVVAGALWFPGNRTSLLLELEER